MDFWSIFYKYIVDRSALSRMVHWLTQLKYIQKTECRSQKESPAMTSTRFSMVGKKEGEDKNRSVSNGCLRRDFKLAGFSDLRNELQVWSGLVCLLERTSMRMGR